MIAQDRLCLSRIVLNPRDRGARQLLSEPRRLYGQLIRAFEGNGMPHHTGGGEADNGRASEGILYRIEPEPDRRTNGIVVLVQSTLEPNWEHFTGGSSDSLLLGEPALSQPFSVQLPVGSRLRFRLHACPVRTPAIPASANEHRPNGKRRSGRRIPVFAPVIDEFEPLLRMADKEQHSRLTALKNARIEAAIADWLVRKLEGAAKIPPVAANSWLSFGQDNEDAPPLDLRTIRKNPLRLRGQPAYNNRPRRGDFDPVLFEGHIVVQDSEALAQTVRQGIGPGKAFGLGLLSLARA